MSQYPQFSRLAISALLASVFSATPNAAEELPTVVVSASRFSEAQPNVAANISVITREEIRSIPAQNLPDVLRVRAGIDVRPLYGAMGMDTTVDMRGFGSTGTSNTLILIDGLRVNPIDMGSIIWSAIPLDSVDRIEITRGAGTVLYGDGATGGVINIVTNKSGKYVANATATVGSYGYKGIDAQLANGNDQAYFNLNLRHADANGYRDNAQQDQQTASGRAGLLLGEGEIFADFALYKESAGLPGNRLSAAYRNDPRGTLTPDDKQRRDGYRIRPGVSYQLNSRVAVEAEITVDHQNLQSDYVKSAFFSDRVRDTLSFTPRLRWRHDLAALSSETVFGIDYYDGKVTSDNQGGPDQKATQRSSAAYVQNITGLTSRLNLILGGRSQQMKQGAQQDAFAAWFTPAMKGDATRTRNAYDIGLAHAGDGWRIYGKTGTTFRFANTDELFGSDPFGLPIFAGDLKPQHGRINELGGNLVAGAVSARASVYQLNLTDEIGYDGAAFANVNLSPTRRNGAEAEIDWMISNRLTAKMAYAYIDAKFRDGNYDGKTLPLVPRNQASLQVIWNAGLAGDYSALLRHVGERRYGSDFANTQGMLDGYTTLDLQAGWNLKPWRITAKLLNATDRKYAPFAGYSAFRNDTYYYPADGRSLFVAGRIDF